MVFLLILFPLVCLLHSFCLPLQGTKTMWQLTLLPALASINLRADTACTHWRSTGRSSFSRPNKFFSKSHWNNSLVDTFFVCVQRIKHVQHYTCLKKKRMVNSVYNARLLIPVKYCTPQILSCTGTHTTWCRWHHPWCLFIARVFLVQSYGTLYSRGLT